MADKDSALRAVDFVEDLILPLAPDGRRGAGPGASSPTAQIAFDSVDPQTLVAGSGVISFVKGVTSERRQDIVNSSLLAQLAANKRVPDRSDLRAWYDVYFEVLTNVGWVLQERSFQQYRERGDDFEAEQAILGIAAAAFGGAASAVGIVKSTLDALKAAAHGKWITLFNRESQTAHAAKFQVTLVDRDTDGDLKVYLMAFTLNAKASLTQVLFFKFRTNDIVFDHSAGVVTIDPEVLAAVRDPVSQKIRAHVSSYVSAVEI